MLGFLCPFFHVYRSLGRLRLYRRLGEGHLLPRGPLLGVFPGDFRIRFKLDLVSVHLCPFLLSAVSLCRSDASRPRNFSCLVLTNY